MLKKSLLGLLLMCVGFVFADNNKHISKKLTQSSSGNPAEVGSRQGSNQVFGEQKLSGKLGEKYNHGGKNISNGPNKPTQGSSNGSNQVFGEQKLTGKSGQNYYKGDKNISDGPNKPTQGSRDGSNQVFGEPPLTR